MIEIPRAKKNMTSLLDSFESDTEKEHDAAVTAAVKTPKKSSKKVKWWRYKSNSTRINDC